MKLNNNSKAFLKKLAAIYKCSEDTALEILLIEFYGGPVGTLSDGKITFINVHMIPSAVEEVWDKNNYNNKPGKILNLNEFDISNLKDLEDLSLYSLADYVLNKEFYSFQSYPNLNSLEYCHHNTLSIDLSSNTKLAKLDCSCNKLKNLDLDNNLDLEELICPGNNISSLDLSKLSKLRYLLLQYNPIDYNELKFPKENRIEELYIDDTPVKYIDFTQFNNLKILRIENTITELDLTNCRNLITLKIFGNEKKVLKELDISNCNYLSELRTSDLIIEKLIFNEFQSFVIPSISKKLKKIPTPEQKSVIKTYDLHSKALSHNWDDGLSKLKKILKDDNCDRATALAIYWMGNPNYYLQYKKVSDAPDHARVHFRFLNKLEKELLEGKYTKKILSFNPRNHNNYNWTIQSLNNDTALRQIDKILKEEVIGNNSDLFKYDSKFVIKNYR